MKKNDIVICINNKNNTSSLTLNKHYTIYDIRYTTVYKYITKVSNTIPILIYVKNDKGDLSPYNPQMFDTLSNIRDSKLNSIL